MTPLHMVHYRDGAPTEIYETWQGLAQGCPASPFLFAVTMRGLIEQLMETVVPPDGEPPIECLSYLDDLT
eukprot:12092314-Prorocentrum_lima.AAC.1